MTGHIAETDEVVVSPDAILVNARIEVQQFCAAIDEIARACREGYNSGFIAAKKAAMGERNSAWRAGFLGGFLAGGMAVGLTWLIVEMLR